MYSVRKLERGDFLIRAGGLEPYIYLLKSGQLAVTKESKGQVKMLGVVNPGEFVGEMAYLTERYENTTNVTAAIDSEVIEIITEDFYDALTKNPLWMKSLIKSLVGRIEALNAKI